jgi:hypothetical protein
MPDPLIWVGHSCVRADPLLTKDPVSLLDDQHIEIVDRARAMLDETVLPPSYDSHRAAGFLDTLSTLLSRAPDSAGSWLAAEGHALDRLVREFTAELWLEYRQKHRGKKNVVRRTIVEHITKNYLGREFDDDDVKKICTLEPAHCGIALLNFWMRLNLGQTAYLFDLHKKEIIRSIPEIERKLGEDLTRRLRKECTR